MAKSCYVVKGSFTKTDDGRWKCLSCGEEIKWYENKSTKNKMFKQFNEETKSFNWVINHWFNKVVYVCGWIFVVLFAIGFIKGLFGIN